jgi:hypothetical protein
MGINVATEKDYSGVIRDLFPLGEYWKKQFADPKSDLNLFCKAKSKEIICLRKRMSELLAESDYQTAVKTLGDWERVILGYINIHLPIEERRQILTTKKIPLINFILIADIAQKYGLTLIDIIFPFKPSFFGFSQFGRSIFSNFAFYSVFYIIVAIQEEKLKIEAKICITKLIKNSLFGQCRFGIDRFFSRSSFIKDYSRHVLSEIKILDDFELDVNNKLIASNIAYFVYKF